MYINKIDQIIDKIIDDFYNNVIGKKKEFNKILKEANFVKYQLDINKILISYEKSIDQKELNKLITNADNVNSITKIIKKYLAYYVFLIIGFHYQNKLETYINNIIEFSKNQASFNFKIENFFNSESNSNIIRFFNMIKNIVKLLNADQNQLSSYIKKDEFAEAIRFLNDFGQEFVTKNFKLENLGGNKLEQGHNIVKTIILNELYFKQDKKDVVQILEAAEREQGEYIFIDIVVPKEEYIDFLNKYKIRYNKEMHTVKANSIIVIYNLF